MFFARTRNGTTILLVLAVLVLLGYLLARLSILSTGEQRLTRMRELAAEHQYHAEAVIARAINRLKKRPWVTRYYAEGPPGTGPHGAMEQGSYQDGDYQLWVEDIELPSSGVVPGLVDLFVYLEFDGRSRYYHYRLSLPFQELRRGFGIGIEYLGASPHDLREPLKRNLAASEATVEMIEADHNQDCTRSTLDLLPGDFVRALHGGRGDDTDAGRSSRIDLASEELADALLVSDVVRQEIHRKTRQELERGIMLMGESGKGLQDLLSPLERHRFTNRSGDLPAARTHLQEAIELGSEIPRMRALARSALIRSLIAESWQRGPASEEGRELIQRAREESARTLTELEEGGDTWSRQFGPALIANSFLDAIRAALVSGDMAAAEEILVQGAQILDGTSPYGNGADFSDLAGTLVDALTRVSAVARISSDQPLPPSGFEPIAESEVDDFLREPEQGWDTWIEGSGKSPPWWDEDWADRVESQGEGGSGQPNGDIDRDGDGIVDADGILEGPDLDGNGIHDQLPENGVSDDCAAACQGTLSERLECLQRCADAAREPPPTVADSAAAASSGSLPPTDVRGNGEQEVTVLEPTTATITAYLSVGERAGELEVVIVRADGSREQFMDWERRHTDDLSLLKVNGQEVPGSVVSNRINYADPRETSHQVELQPGDRVVASLSGNVSRSSYISIR